MTLLVLGGTGEAQRIGRALQGTGAIVSLAGATRTPAPQDLETVTGGFGGAEGFCAFLRTRKISAVLDATHPFAARITARSAACCAQMDVPFLQLLRPPWVARAGDNWTEIAREEEAAEHIPDGATVFLGTGRSTLMRFDNLQGRHIICRQIDPPQTPFPFAGGRFLVGRPPFSEADEVALFQRLGVDVLVVKNAGGAASRSKLDAARRLGIPVLMIKRPPLGDWPRVDTVQAALAWVNGL